MKHLVVAFVVVASLSLAVPDASAQTSALEGTVCAPDGRMYIMAPQDCRGAPGANVSLAAAAAPDVDVLSTVADEDGRFSFDPAPDGDYVLRVQRAGFEPLQQDVTLPTKSLMLYPEARTVDQQAIVIGKAPVAGARIEACCTEQASAISREDGTLSLPLRAGWHSLNVRAPGHMDAVFDLFVDGTGQLELQVEPLPPPDAWITGTVRDQDGAPVAGASVDAWTNSYQKPSPEPSTEPSTEPSPEPRPAADAPESRMVMPSQGNRTTTAADGSYRLGVMAGTVSLSFSKDGHAGAWTEVEASKGSDVRHDQQLLRYPERTARLEGTIRGPPADMLQYISVQVESPLYGRYECSRTDAVGTDGRTESRTDGGTDGGSSPGSEGGADTAQGVVADTSMPAYEGCAIQLDPDGSFSGLVTPGYSIVRIHFQEWMACDGDSDCHGYIPFVQTMQLPADETTTLDVRLTAKPQPSTVVSGYLVDEANAVAIPDGHISFSRVDGSGYGWATTDKDGSYRIRIDEGVYEVQAWAQGFLSWAGIVEVTGSRSFDVPMTAGSGSWAQPRPLAVAEDGLKAPAAEGAPTATGADGDNARTANDGSAGQYQDLGGGLGPYDEASRRMLDDGSGSGQGAPGLPLVAAVLGLMAVLVLRRRT